MSETRRTARAVRTLTLPVDDVVRLAALLCANLDAAQLDALIAKLLYTASKTRR